MVRERVRLLKLTDKFDIYDPETGEQIGFAKEEPSSFALYGRLLFKKRSLPNQINFYTLDTPNDESSARLVWGMSKPFTFIRSRFYISTSDGKSLGMLQSKIFTIGGGLKVFTSDDRQIADVKGNLIGWNYKLNTLDGVEIGLITKKWAGGVKEFFTTADNYLVAVDDKAPKGANVMLLCAAIAIDAVYKESN